jgi:hypothetical protein
MRRLYVVGVDVLPAERFRQQVREAAQHEEEDSEVRRAPQGSALVESLSPARIPGCRCRRAWRSGDESHHTDRSSPRRGFVPTCHFTPSHRQ